MVIIDLMRLMGTLADGATGEITVASAAERGLAEKWCARSGNTVLGADVDGSGAAAPTVRRGRPPRPAGGSRCEQDAGCATVDVHELPLQPRVRLLLRGVIAADAASRAER